MSDGRQKSERRTTLIKFKATLLPPSITLIKNNFDSTGTGCGLFLESKARQIVRRQHDGLEFESGYNNAHWLQKVAIFSLSLSKKEKEPILY